MSPWARSMHFEVPLTPPKASRPWESFDLEDEDDLWTSRLAIDNNVAAEAGITLKSAGWNSGFKNEQVLPLFPTHTELVEMAQRYRLLDPDSTEAGQLYQDMVDGLLHDPG